ncbi:MAG: glutamate mutase L [Nocardioides sp.]|nr:glutamate mutase L [Nocardioides sp.]
MSPSVACVDLGSTFTKAALVELGSGRLLATAEHPTTVATDVLEGWHACRDALAAVDPSARDAPVLACSSAGGGLRIAVVGNEELVTAEAGRRVALSSGGHVVGVLSGGLADAAALDRLRATAPDVVLVVGGTDGGEEETVPVAARTLAEAGWSAPVVVAGNREVGDVARAALAEAGVPHLLAANVVPRIGVLAPEPARAAVRQVFVAHVIGGKGLSAGPDLAAMVRGATPDVVLAGVELLARGVPAEGLAGVGDVVVVDVGGATTDVHACVEPDPGLHPVVGATASGRTVEGDLGMRWSAVTTVGQDPGAGPDLRAAAERRRADPGLVPTEPAETAYDERLAVLAAGTALRRHAGRSEVVYDGGGRVVVSTGRDLRTVDLVIGSGGVLRHAAPAVAERVLRAAWDADPGWQLPQDPRVLVDADYVLAAAGLLATDHPGTAYRLLRGHLDA